MENLIKRAAEDLIGRKYAIALTGAGKFTPPDFAELSATLLADSAPADAARAPRPDLRATARRELEN